MTHETGFVRTAIVLGLGMALVGCGAEPPGEDPEQRQMAKSLDCQPIQLRGREFLRTDCWDEDELARLKEEGRPTRSRPKSARALVTDGEE